MITPPTPLHMTPRIVRLSQPPVAVDKGSATAKVVILGAMLANSEPESPSMAPISQAVPIPLTVVISVAMNIADALLLIKTRCCQRGIARATVANPTKNVRGYTALRYVCASSPQKCRSKHMDTIPRTSGLPIKRYGNLFARATQMSQIAIVKLSHATLEIMLSTGAPQPSKNMSAK